MNDYVTFKNAPITEAVLEMPDVAIIVTVYEPTLPKWTTPFERGRIQ